MRNLSLHMSRFSALAFVSFLFIFLSYIPGAAFAATADMPQETADLRQAFTTGAIVVKGEGAAPDKPMTQAQKRVLALRAAKVAAFREASEMLDGVAVTGDTTVKNASADSDTVRIAVQGIVRGAQVIREVYDPAAGAAVIFLSVPLPGAAGAIIPQLPASSLSQYQPQSLIPGASYDGLIIDARGLQFKPALVNRVLTKDNEVLYDPSRVQPGVLAKKGGAEYTNDMEKARALLAARGSANPAAVRASQAASPTDITLEPGDAAAVFSANQATGFLHDAKVVFVID